MAALDFPASPTDGQVYGNWIWNAAKGAWKAKPLTPMKATPSDTPPASPTNGDQWLNTVDGCLYTYYTDVDGSQWVQVKNDASFSSTLGPRVDAMEASANTNYIINGAFDIWQRGTSFTPTNGVIVYTADRFWVYRDTGSAVTVSQQTFTPGAAPAPGYEGTYFYRFAQTTTGSGGTLNYIAQYVEDARTLAGQTATLSFWAKADSTRTITPKISRGYGSGGSTEEVIATGSAITLTTSWARYTTTFTIPSIAGKTIGANSNIAVLLALSNNTVQTVDIWGVQLQAGSTATAFHRNAPSLQAELAACQRYYWRQSANATINAYTVGDGTLYSTTGGLATVKLPVSMRTAPSSMEYSGSHKINNGGSQYAIGSIALISNVTTENIASLSYVVTSGLSGFVGRIIGGASSDYMGFSAEL